MFLHYYFHWFYILSFRYRIIQDIILFKEWNQLIVHSLKRMMHFKRTQLMSCPSHWKKCQQLIHIEAFLCLLMCAAGVLCSFDPRCLYLHECEMKILVSLMPLCAQDCLKAFSDRSYGIKSSHRQLYCDLIVENYWISYSISCDNCIDLYYTRMVFFTSKLHTPCHFL